MGTGRLEVVLQRLENGVEPLGTGGGPNDAARPGAGYHSNIDVRADERDIGHIGRSDRASVVVLISKQVIVPLFIKTSSDFSRRNRCYEGDTVLDVDAVLVLPSSLS